MGFFHYSRMERNSHRNCKAQHSTDEVTEKDWSSLWKVGGKRCWQLLTAVKTLNISDLLCVSQIVCPKTCSVEVSIADCSEPHYAASNIFFGYFLHWRDLAHLL